MCDVCFLLCISSGSQYSLALAYNWVGDNVYITEFDGQDELVICTAHGSSCATVAVAGIGACTGLALDPTERYNLTHFTHSETCQPYRTSICL